MKKRYSKGWLLAAFSVFMAVLSAFMSVMFFIYSDLIFGLAFAVFSLAFGFVAFMSLRIGIRDNSIPLKEAKDNEE